MRIDHLSTEFPGLAVPGVGLEVVPQVRIALHVKAAPPRQAGIFALVKHDEGTLRRVIRGLSGPQNHGVHIHVQLDVALHHNGARLVNTSGEKEDAAAGLGGDGR